MNISKYINFKVFFFSLIFGLFAVYVTSPDTRKIYVYPNPDYLDVLQFKDKTDTCFTIKQTEVKCPANESEITKPLPQS